jgi:hypothetical protein
MPSSEICQFSLQVKMLVQNKVTLSTQADNWTDLNTCGIPCECLSLIKMKILAIAGMSFAPC